MKKVGILPGTFDPIHQGHIGFVQTALDACGLAKVVFLPEPMPRQKAKVTPFGKRVAQLEATVVNHSHMQVMQLSAKQFSIDKTLPELQDKLAGCELTLLIGSDVVRTFAYRWPGLGQLLSSVSLIIGLRDDHTAAQCHILLQQLKVPVRYTIIKSPYATMSSSRIRQLKRKTNA